MFSFLKKIYRNRQKDRADGTLVLFLISVPLFVILLGFCINVNTSIGAKNEYNSMAQTSADSAIKTLNANGVLGKEAVAKFVTEYRKQYSEYSAAPRRGTDCSTMIIDERGMNVEHKMPYMRITLDTGRSINGTPDQSRTYLFEGADPVVIKDSPGAAKYKVISVEVYTASNNLLDAFGIPSCQLHKSSASAIAFGTNYDLG